MSGRVRKQPDCPVGKQGPMRATLPVSSIMKQASGLRTSCGNSPTLSPTNAWRRISPDSAHSGQRSPGALNYKGKGRTGSNSIRRTASLDTLYQKGQWPRDFYLHAGLLQVNKATQTEDVSGSNSSGRLSRGPEEDKLDKFLRQRIQRTPSKASAAEHSSQTMASIVYGSLRVSGVGMPLRAARSSVEGLNQEIERIVLQPGYASPIERLRDKGTPEGRRAPLAELLRRSVNTQTPHDSSHTCSSGTSSRESVSSGYSPERFPGGSVCSSPETESRLGTSPQINRFLAREPPDGCEKVNLKCTWDGAGGAEAAAASPCPVIKPAMSGFQLRASQGSAFHPLQASARPAACDAPTPPASPPDSPVGGADQ